jgi:hypothetical protein
VAVIFGAPVAVGIVGYVLHLRSRPRPDDAATKLPAGKPAIAAGAAGIAAGKPGIAPPKPGLTASEGS